MKPFALYIILIVSLLLTGCKTIQYYPLETVRHDTVYIQSVKLDSILVKDSIHITERGDTPLSLQGGHRERPLSRGEGAHQVAIREGRLRRLGYLSGLRLYSDCGGADGL